MADVEEPREAEQLNDRQKKEIAKWFLLNSPTGEIQYVAKDVRSVLDDDRVYNEAAAEAFPVYNKSHMICLEMPGRTGDNRGALNGEGTTEMSYLPSNDRTTINHPVRSNDPSEFCTLQNIRLLYRSRTGVGNRKPSLPRAANMPTP